jgi:tRNA threonylcarbamoyladenosine biosynthesis protein TsaE
MIHPLIVKTIHWKTENDTTCFAKKLATTPLLSQAFITLEGTLGAGKTAFARHLLRALGVLGHIKSPTYALVESYEINTLRIWHFDFYRFHDAQEWEDAGFRDIFCESGLKLAEWPANVSGLIPTPDLAINIVEEDLARRVTLHANTPLGVQILELLDHE